MFASFRLTDVPSRTDGRTSRSDRQPVRRPARSLGPRPTRCGQSVCEVLEPRYCFAGDDVFTLTLGSFQTDATDPQSRLAAELSVGKILENDGGNRFISQAPVFGLMNQTNNANLKTSVQGLQIVSIKYVLPVRAIASDLDFQAAKTEVENAIATWYNTEKSQVADFYRGVDLVLDRVAGLVGQWNNGYRDAGWITSNGLGVTKDALPTLLPLLPTVAGSPMAGLSLSIGERAMDVLSNAIGRSGTNTIQGLLSEAKRIAFVNCNAENARVDNARAEFVGGLLESWRDVKTRDFGDDSFVYQDVVKVGPNRQLTSSAERRTVTVRMGIRDYSPAIDAVAKWHAAHKQALSTHVLANEVGKSLDTRYGDALVQFARQWGGVKFDPVKQCWAGSTSPPAEAANRDAAILRWMSYQSAVFNDLDIAAELNRIGYKPAGMDRRYVPATR